MAKRIASKTPAQKNYAAKKEKIDELKRVANKAAHDAVKAWKAQNLGCEDLAIKAMNIAYVRPKGGTTKAMLEIASHMAYSFNHDKTQSAILKQVQSQFPDVTLYDSLWQRKISKSLMKKIEVAVNGNLQKPISFKGCNTLAQIRKKIKISQQTAKGFRTFKVTITFTREMVMIGNQTYTVEKRPTGLCIRVKDKRGKRHLLRLAGLAAALLKAES